MGTTRCLDEISYYKYCFNLPDVNITVGRLLQNATHMGLSLEPFYGEDAVKKYSTLIKDHLVIAADLVKAAKAGDQIQLLLSRKMVR